MFKREFRKTGGYFTVEASMIVPVAVALTGMIFYLAFYLYDQCIVTQDTYILAFRGSLCCGLDAGEVKRDVLSESADRFRK